MESEELDSDELMEDGEDVVEEDTEDILGYLTPPWLFDLLLGERPLLQVGLSEPRRRNGGDLSRWVELPHPEGGGGGRPTGGVDVRVGGSVVGAEEAGVALLGLGRVDVQAAHLSVRAVHHLHKLTTPGGGGSKKARYRHGDAGDGQRFCGANECLWQHNSICDGGLENDVD